MFEYFILFILGLCFGSFSTVLISRWHSGKGGIMMGRSECPHCNHTLTASELVPLLSWATQGGACKNCKAPVPLYYPVSELIFGCIFMLMGWISMNFGYSILDVMFWVFIFWGFVTTIYIIYDIRYMEIPDQIMIPGILVTLGIIVAGFLGSKYQIFFDYSSYPTFHTFISDHISAAVILYSFFFLQILIPGGIYLIRNHDYKNLLGLIVSYFIFPILMILEFFFPKKLNATPEKEIPAWIGGGDLRIAIFIGLTLGTIHSLSTLIFAYMIGGTVGIFILASGKIKKQKTPHEIPFGPFLGIGWILSLLFYFPIIDYLKILYI